MTIIHKSLKSTCFLKLRNPQDKLGRTPLHNAVAAGCDDLAKGLIEEKASPGERGSPV